MCRVLCAALLALAAPGCGFPSPESCALACGVEGACPDGFQCQSATQLCVALGTRQPCERELAAVGANEPGAASAARDAGAQTSGTGGRGAGSESEVSGGAGGAGAPSSLPSSGELAIIEAASTGQSSCTGSPLHQSLRATGGVAPYTWRVLQAPGGVPPLEGGAEVFEVSGVPSAPGTLLVELADSTGNSVRSTELVVHQSPQIATERLPPICSGETYAARLVAAGGEAEEYVWSARRVPAAGLSATLEELGLAIDGSTLAGDVSAENEASAVEVALSVTDTHCRSSELELPLEVVPAQSGECTRIEIANASASGALPAPCRGSYYAETLIAEGGEPPYVWAASELPPGLTFDAESATLYGVPEADGVFALELTDAHSRVRRQSYTLQLRDKCWMAYVAGEPSPARLELVDARLLERQPDNARRSLPATATSEAVTDFKFAPGGRFLAYRLGQSNTSQRLELVRLSDGQTQALDLGGSVQAYAWSEDDASLAVAITRGAQSFLAGVDVSAVAALGVAAAGSGLDGVHQLEASAAPSVDSELVFYARSHLAFLSRGSLPTGRRQLVTTALGPTGIAAFTTHAGADFSDGAALVPAADGVFAADPETGLHELFPDAAPSSIRQAPGVVLSANGGFVGLAAGGALEIFHASDASGADAAPFLRQAGCTTLLAWANHRERLACADEREAQANISFFDIVAAPAAALNQLSPMQEVYAYGPAGQSGRRRVFSASARWFAFATDDNLYLSHLDERAAQLSVTLPSSVLGTRASALAFSPDETCLLIGAGNSLSLIDLDKGLGSWRELSTSALSNDTCSERFVDGRGQWCGSEAAAPDPFWSSGSDLVAFRSSLGTLQIVDVTPAGQGRAISPDPDCSEACRSGESARFQP
jgi:hypothetical protein